MPRIPRVVVPGVPHHVVQRGNRREDVFFLAADRLRHMDLLRVYSNRHGLAVVAYCLMSNHVHLVVTPRDAQTLCRTLKPVHLRYAQHVNWTHRLCGRLWQGRFFSYPLDESHFWAAIPCVERNPVRAGLVDVDEVIGRRLKPRSVGRPPPEFDTCSDIFASPARSVS